MPVTRLARLDSSFSHAAKKDRCSLGGGLKSRAFPYGARKSPKVNPSLGFLVAPVPKSRRLWDRRSEPSMALPVGPQPYTQQALDVGERVPPQLPAPCRPSRPRTERVRVAPASQAGGGAALTPEPNKSAARKASGSTAQRGLALRRSP